MIPEKIGKYTVLELLGRGGMGEVYLGEDPYIGRRVAIKIIKGADPEARDRFLHEARVIGGLAHPAIVSLLDFDFSGTEPFLVMEYLKGQGLDAWIRQPRSLPEQLVVLEDLCHALAYAHENGVLHRDVKPSNVQVLPSGHAKLMDFGIARASSGKLTATGAVMGTPDYMAPEILNDVAYSTRSDLYACAVLLYEMFTGKNPFSASTVAASLTNVLTLNPPDVRTVVPGFPPRLAETLMACLRKEPALRPDGFGALIAAGQEALAGSTGALPETRAITRASVKAPVGPLGPRASAVASGPSTRERLTPWNLLGGVSVVGVVGLVWILSRGAAPTAPAEVPTSPASVAPALPHASPSPMDALTVALPTPSPIPGRETRATPPSTPRREAERIMPPVSRPEPTPAATPAPLPTATAAPVVAAPLTVATPQPRPVPSATPLVAATPVPGEPTQPAVSLTGVSPRALRRGSSVDLEVQGEGLRKDLKAIVMQGRRPAAGIRVLRVDFVSSRIIRLRVLIEAETPLLTYSLVFQDSSGVVSQGLQIEVVL